MTTQTVCNTVIIGAGAAGLMCAGSVKGPKLVLDSNAQPGRKLNISGGGKCNFTNRYITAQKYRCNQKHFCHRALAAFSYQTLLNMLEQARIPYTQTDTGCFFAKRATDITQWLTARAQAANTTFSFHTQVLRMEPNAHGFCLDTSKGKIYAKQVVLASGGMSYPQVGGSAFTWQAAKQLGINTIAPQPVLVGLRADKTWKPVFRALAGNSLPVLITVDKRVQTGPLLFTHEGISGPSVLQSSLYWQEGTPLLINFIPQLDVLNYLKQHKQNQLFSKILSPYISAKIAEGLLQELDILAANASKNSLVAAAERLTRFSFMPTGTMGYAQAEATAGGIDVAEIDAGTMQSKKIAGLFIIGEALDVTGPVGGFNLHWAWASAQAAATALNHMKKY